MFFIYKGLLIYAVEANNYPVLVSCISHGADVNNPDKNNLTPLHYAIFKGYLHLAATLLQGGADPNAVDNQTRPPLCFAVRRGDIRAMKLLLDYGANPDAIVTTKGELKDPRLRERSLLAIAVYNGMADAAKMLLEYSANPHPGGMPPLLAALNNETREGLAVLLDGRPGDVLLEFEGKPFILHAIEQESNLLPVIVSLVQEEIEKLKSKNASRVPSFPPKKLKRKQKRALKKAMKLRDRTISSEFVDREVKAIKSPWQKPVEDDGMTGEQSSTDTSAYMSGAI